jgi:hypothetical protein
MHEWRICLNIQVLGILDAPALNNRVDLGTTIRSIVVGLFSFWQF